MGTCPPSIHRPFTSNFCLIIKKKMIRERATKQSVSFQREPSVTIRDSLKCGSNHLCCCFSLCSFIIRNLGSPQNFSSLLTHDFTYLFLILSLSSLSLFPLIISIRLSLSNLSQMPCLEGANFAFWWKNAQDAASIFIGT